MTIATTMVTRPLAKQLVFLFVLLLSFLHCSLTALVAVGALGNDGTQSFYSEPCAALLVTAPSSAYVTP